MPRQSEPRLFVAIESGSVQDPDEGVSIPLVKGRTLVDENDPVYRAHKELFAPAQPRRYKGRVEQATAAPGEKR